MLIRIESELDALCRKSSLQCRESDQESLFSPDNTTSLVWTGVDPVVKHILCIFSSALQILICLDGCLDSIGAAKDNNGVLKSGD
jgi:hypothetical protein